MDLKLLFVIIFGTFLSSVLMKDLNNHHKILKRQYVKPIIDGIWLAEEQPQERIFNLKFKGRKMNMRPKYSQQTN
ncbi:unnamed protein product [Brachionus calyciflorus]|uniref:Uncharacterized protein n=1 Tax=Brachionus calyciflorus TaxID=104777 RepID=A0A813PJJ3_9BILA|nr:unnamed protein product [Brachionus calyciflorus]